MAEGLPPHFDGSAPIGLWMEQALPAPTMRADATQRSNTKSGPLRARCILLSLALHAPIGAVAALAHAREAEPAPEVKWSVEASMFAHSAPPPSASANTTHPVEAERDTPAEPPALHEPDVTDAGAPAVAPEPRSLLVDPAPTFRKDALAQAVAASLPRAPRAPADQAEPASPQQATTADATSTAPASSERRPQVLSPLPGHNPRPDYPESARRRGVEGVVVVRIEVDEHGEPIGCAVAQSSGSVALDEAAMRAARKWRFEDGPGSVDVPFRFAIESRAISARR